MEKFHFVADATFEAEDTDAALLKLEQHLKFLRYGFSNLFAKELHFVGQMSISPQNMEIPRCSNGVPEPCNCAMH